MLKTRELLSIVYTMPNKRKRESTLSDGHVAEKENGNASGKSRRKLQAKSKSDANTESTVSDGHVAEKENGNASGKSRRKLQAKSKTDANTESTVSDGHMAEKEKASGKTRRKLQAKSKTDTNTVQYSHWLMKSEPNSRIEKGVDVKFGIEDLKLCPDQTACWDGVRNYQARNFMKKMTVGDKVFFYHSNTKEPGIAGLCEIAKESYVDHTQFDPKDPHYDKSSKKDKPVWFMVDVKFNRMMKRYLPLSELKSLHLKHKASGGALKDIALFTKSRLSVQPLTQEEWDFIMSLEEED